MCKLLRLCVVLSLGCLLPRIAPLAAAPLFRESLALTNQTIQVIGFNDAGDVLAQFSLPENGLSREQPVVVRGAALLRLTPVPDPEVTVAQANGISPRRADGHVLIAGVAHLRDGFRRAAVWDLAQDGTYTFTLARNLILPPDSSAPGEQTVSEGFAINRAGILVGSGSSFLASIAVRWAPPYEVAQGLLLSTSSRFVDVQEDGAGLANGIEFGSGGEAQRFSSGLISASGVVTEIPRLDPSKLEFSNDASMWRGDWVVGNAQLGQNLRGFAWKVGSSSAVNLPNPAFQPAAENLHALSINAAGTAIGFINGGPGAQSLILWTQAGGNFTPHRFSDLVPALPSLDPRADYALNNSAGQVAVVVRDRLFGVSTLRVYDPVTDGLVQLLTESATASEDAGRLEFKVRLTRAAGNTAPVNLSFQTADDTATAPLHYTASTGSVTWASGEAGEKTIMVTLNNNPAFDEQVAFKLRLGALTGAVLSGPTEAVGTIFDPFPIIQLRNQALDVVGNGTVEVQQGATQVVLEFERSGGSDGALTLNGFKATDFTALVGVDYLTTPSVTLRWARGELGVKSLMVPLVNAGPLATARIFTVTGEAQLEGASDPWPVLATVTILPAGTERTPEMDPREVRAAGDNLVIVVRSPQGSILQLQQRSSLGGVWTLGQERISTTGITTFQVPLSTETPQAFFQARLKP